jgi:hypothetical protein
LELNENGLHEIVLLLSATAMTAGAFSIMVESAMAMQVFLCPPDVALAASAIASVALD